MTFVTAPSRLHFGLLNLPRDSATHWPVLDTGPGLAIRNFGGVGLMIDEPRVTVSVEPAKDWSFEGPLCHRAEEFARRFVGTLNLNGKAAFHVAVLDCPEEHCGLGVGTALALAVAKALAIEIGHREWNSIELAKRVGRGERSAIGIHGFQRGGLIVEAGKLSGEVVSPLVGAYHFPEAWRIALIRPSVAYRWSGERERQGFHNLAGQVSTETAVLSRIIVGSLIPSLAIQDFREFSQAIYEYNRRVGCLFRIAQGGDYSDPEIERLVNELRQFGVVGVGQSSWGPTVFALLENEDEVDSLRVEFRSRYPVRVVIANQSGFRAELLS